MLAGDPQPAGGHQLSVILGMRPKGHLKADVWVGVLRSAKRSSACWWRSRAALIAAVEGASVTK
jgi:hypothetical protein